MVKILDRGAGIQDWTQQTYARQQECHNFRKKASYPDPSRPNTSKLGTYL